MEDIEEQNGTAVNLSPAVVFDHSADEDFILTWVAKQTLTRGLAFMRLAKWQTSRGIAAFPSDALECAAITPHRHLALLTVRDILVLIEIDGHGSCTAQMYAERLSDGDFEAVLAQLKGWLEPKVERDADRVSFGFRYNAARYPQYYTRAVEAPAWSEIRDNYAAPTKGVVDRLMDLTDAPAGGRLLLFHGPPGTGKTYVIRALARQWRTWCGAEYIADPESFFGDAEYMMHVLIAGAHDVGEDGDAADASAQRWRLLVLEDAGELLARDAKMHQGQGLSRLLNLGEGLIGQGLRVMTLISTNERLDAVNAAVARPGRTAAECEFLPLSSDECAAWLARRELAPVELPLGATLAELFEIESGRPSKRQPPRRPLGFRKE